MADLKLTAKTEEELSSKMKIVKTFTNDIKTGLQKCAIISLKWQDSEERTH